MALRRSPRATKQNAKGTSRASKPRRSSVKSKSLPKTGVKSKSLPKAGVKAKSLSKTGVKAKSRVGQAPPALLTGGNPRIAKADGDGAVQAYIAAMPGWKRDLGRRLDALIVRNVPHVCKAVKWNSPFYGVEGQGWFLGIHTFTRYVKVAFFRGASLRPIPPGESKSKDTRYVDIPEGHALDEVQFAAWVKQAAALPGWLS